MKKRSQWLLPPVLTLRVNRIIQSSEDMILTLAGQFKQLSHEPEEFLQVHETIA